jgi:hypothetical protein
MDPQVQQQQQQPPQAINVSIRLAFPAEEEK